MYYEFWDHPVYTVYLFSILGNSPMKKFLLKMVLFILILTFCQATAYVFIKKPFPPFNQMLISSANHKTDIAFLSDSSAFWVANEDEDQSNTVEMLQRNLSAVTVVAFMYPAFDLNTYKYIVEYIARNIQCRAIVMSVNLRSFSAQWDKNPMHEFRNEKMVMHYGQNYLFRIFINLWRCLNFFKRNKRSIIIITRMSGGGEKLWAGSVILEEVMKIHPIRLIFLRKNLFYTICIP